MEIKDKIQSRAVSLSRDNQNVCLEWSTGCGKTLAAVKIAEDIILSNPDSVGYLVCKESTHKKNWHDDIIKHKRKHIVGNLTTLLYASLKKYSKKADFVILDECHALTPKRIEAMKGILKRGTKLIFLSATIPDERKYSMIRLCKKIKFDTITLVEAIELGLLPAPELVVHKMILNPEQQIEYDSLSAKMYKQKDLSESLTAHHTTRNAARNRFLNLGSRRKNFIAEVKTERLRELVKSFRKEDARFICFTGSIEQAKDIGANSAVHSKNEKGVNGDLIDCFNDKVCKELFAVKMLRESVNLTDVEKGIITQLDSTIGSFYQMLGRCLRHEFPQMHIIVLNGTQDVAYFKKSMDTFDKKYITVV